MSWSSAFNYAKASATGHGLLPQPTQGADANLPMGARIGSLMSVEPAPLMAAEACGGLFLAPSQFKEQVVAISSIKVGMDNHLYRYYVAKGDEGTDREAFLQVLSDVDGKALEIYYCSRLARFIPESASDQAAFMGESGVGLGDATFTLWREQLAAFGVPKAMLDSAFRDGEGIDFKRDTSDTESFVPPYKGIETRIDDTGGFHGLRQQVCFMPYVRTLPVAGGKEMLMISTEIVEEQDGAAKRGIHVDFLICVPLALHRVVMQ